MAPSDEERRMQYNRQIDFEKRSSELVLQPQFHNIDNFSSADALRQDGGTVFDLGGLNRFQPPELPRIFKSEPMDEEEWLATKAAEKEAINNRKKQEKEARDRAREQARLDRLAGRRRAQRNDSEDVNLILDSSRERSYESSRQRQQRTVVDLTDDLQDTPEATNERPQPPPQPLRPLPSQPRLLTEAQVQLMDQVEVPNNILQQARDIYARGRTAFPTNVRKWSDFKIFVAQHPSFITPQLCLIAQAHAFQSASAPPKPQHNVTSQPPTPASVPSVSNAYTGNVETADSIDPPRSRGRSDSNTLIGMRQIKVEAEEADQLQRESLDRAEASHRPLVPARHRPPPSLTQYTALPERNVRPQVAAPSRPIVPQVPQPPSRPVLSAAQIKDLAKPVDLMSDILSPIAPEGHPHLIKIWDSALLDLPIDKHEHLNLPDTVVSILARYDLKTRSAIQAFLDVDGTNHFFFLFKAREGDLHSWSVEREEDTITIGIERNQRHIHDHENPRPSSGQYDLTIQYRIMPSPPQPLPPADSSTSPPPTSKVPGRWLLHNTTVLPTSPPIHEFLHHTPPTRGADSHALITHPPQTHLLTTSTSSHVTSLSVFARYMQHTFFRSSLVEAEIQCVWGRKVRWDGALGRVRALWDYALKGAKTQREKRERGDYNRPKNLGTSAPATMRRGSGSRSVGSGVPGAGETKDFLSRHRAETARASTTLGPGLDGFVVGDEVVDEEVAEHERRSEQGSEGAAEGEEAQERARKRLKLKKERNQHESDSEWYEGSDSD